MVVKVRLKANESARLPVPYTIQWVRSRFKANQNWLCTIVGGTGTGKSYSALAIAKAIDPTFNSSRVVFTPQEFVKIITEGNLKSGQMVIYDEAGIGLDSRSWFSIQNKALNYILQTFRRDNVGVILTVPDLTFIDKNARKLMHTLIETQKLRRKSKRAYVKWFNLSVAKRHDKIYFLYPKYVDSTGKMTTINHVRIKMPPQDLIADYEIRKKEFVDALKRDMYTELTDAKTHKKLTKQVLTKLMKKIEEISA